MIAVINFVNGEKINLPDFQVAHHCLYFQVNLVVLLYQVGLADQEDPLFRQIQVRRNFQSALAALGSLANLFLQDLLFALASHLSLLCQVRLY